MRITLAGLLVVPLVSLVALWAFAASITLGSAVREHNYNRLVALSAAPTDALANQVSQERQQAFTWLSTDPRPPSSQLAASRDRTSAAVGTELVVVWGRPGTNQQEIRATVTTLPFVEDTRRIRFVGVPPFEKSPRVVNREVQNPKPRSTQSPLKPQMPRGPARGDPAPGNHDRQHDRDLTNQYPGGPHADPLSRSF